MRYGKAATMTAVELRRKLRGYGGETTLLVKVATAIASR
jgi:hypothetical protein